MTEAPGRIWLQHADDADPSLGRMWCEDKVWPDGPEDHEPTEFVRADIVEELRAALEECAEARMPGEARRIARLALSRLAEVSNG